MRIQGWLVGVAGLVAGALVTGLAIWVWPESSNEDGLERGELVILSGADESVGRWRHTLVEMWNAEHPRNQARIIELQQIADGQRAEMIAEASANPDVDIYNLDVTMIAEFADPPGKKPFIQPLDQSRLPPGFLDGFLANPLATCRYKDDDTLWALPFNTDAGLLFYRNDLMAKPPTTWDQVVEMGNQAQAPGSTAAYVGQLGQYEGLTVNALEAIWAEGGEVVDDTGTVVATAETMRAGVRRLLPQRGSAREVIHPTARQFDEAASREAFASGEALFMRNWPVHYLTLLNNDSADVSQPKRVPFMVTALPGSAVRVPGPSVLGGQNLAIAASSKEPKAAQALIEFMTQESSQLLLARYGGFAATRKAPYKDAAVRAAYPYTKVLEEAVEHAKLRPVTPHYATFTKVFRAVVTSAMDKGGEPPPGFAETLTAALQGRES